ncbi:MAG: hypothetical protein E4H28_02775 [Gemmatimonadales bacterium]|nr:MAG: hypothetical protein E4H28_02775 [Gemmatimonadales bacterium]
MVPVDTPDLQLAYDTLREELRAHDPALAAFAHCLVMTKSDLLAPEDRPDIAASIHAPQAWAKFVISSVSREGLIEVCEALWIKVAEMKQRERGVDDLFPELDEWKP